MSDHVQWDKKLRGFGLRTRDGKRTWIYQYKFNGKNRRLKLGDGELPRDEARMLATAEKGKLASAKLGHGIDPATERDQKRAEAQVYKPVAHALGATVPKYLAARDAKLRPATKRAMKMYLEGEDYWKPLHNMALSKIGRVDVAAQLTTITEKNGPVTANRARSALSGLFAWAIGEGWCDTNPVMGTNKRTENDPRERSLSDSEAARLWLATPDNDYGQLLKLILLTGCRRAELGGLKWSEIDLGARTITLPRDRTKNRKEHIVPLSDFAMDILMEVEHDDREHVFGRTRGVGFSGWAKPKEELDAVLKLVQPWTLHDLRRTVRTGLGKLGIAPHIAEAVLNHLPPKLIRTYDRNTYADEKRAALDKWASHLKVCIAQATGTNVTTLSKHAG
jgi:integrase